MTNDSTCSDRGMLLPILEEEEGWQRGGRAFVYLIAMIYTFFGVAIASDRFVCAIETITSSTCKVQIPDPKSNDGVKAILVKKWNDTVVSLTLLAFGTSAPEIMLTTIETISRKFTSGELGPGTIVGSASFNFFVITPICIMSVPMGEVRRLKNLRVFAVTAFTNVFAYIWILVVLMWTSPREVEVWEAVVTLVLFPILVVVAYAVDKRCHCCCEGRNRIAPDVEIGLELEGNHFAGSADIINVAREFQKGSGLSEQEAAKILAAKLTEEQPKRSSWYRVSATRVLTGGPRLLPQVNTAFHELFQRIRTRNNVEAVRQVCHSAPDPIQSVDKAVVEFTSATCAVLENEGHVRLGIRRYGNMEKEVKVGIETLDGTATAHEDYRPARLLLTFKPQESRQDFFVDIVDDDLWEPDEFFFVKLFHDPEEGSSQEEVVLGNVSINQARDQEPNFQVILSSPTGGATIGRIPKAIVTLINDEEFNGIVFRIAARTQRNLRGLQLDTSSWAEQFHDAMNVNGGDLENATRMDYVLHFVTFFWKVLFAFIPPTSICQGKVTFVVSLLFIGLLTALISDLASIFGCLVGLSDYTTAITVVALGTSMPDTFASRAAALHERFADSAIGNINGSNSVNVFLGLGLPWTISTLYGLWTGQLFTVKTESLGLSVSMFSVLAMCTIGILMMRRKLAMFGRAELGDPTLPKYLSSALIACFWLIYLLFSILQEKGVIRVPF